MSECGSVISICANCGRRIQRGEPYMGRIPFVGSWGGFVHQHCRPKLTLIRTSEETPDVPR